MCSPIIQPQDIIRSFNEFNSYQIQKKIHLLEGSGIVLDVDKEDNKITRLYFIHGFFVEWIEDLAGRLLDLIPYRNGYRVDFFLN